MPTYDYRCLECGARFSRTEKIAEHGVAAVPCPTCASPRTETLIGAVYPRTPRKS